MKFHNLVRREAEPAGEGAPTKGACQHTALQFGSGDYYVICNRCGAYWGRLKPGKREGGVDVVTGEPCGTAPEEANSGRFTPDGETRRAPSHIEETANTQSAASAPTPTTPPRDALAEIIEPLRVTATVECTDSKAIALQMCEALRLLRAERTDHEALLAEAENERDYLWENLRAALAHFEKALKRDPHGNAPVDYLWGRSTIRETFEAAVKVLRGEGRPQERSSE